jgi:bifunctional DNA-binding transcriptional regulator/antitoxin component of YhaV-PrlF toxin-antitoxin module
LLKIKNGSKLSLHSFKEAIMLAKKTAKNQITLPKTIAARFPGVDYFEVKSEDDRIVLRPLNPSRAREVRRKLKQLGIANKDVADAVDWARGR